MMLWDEAHHHTLVLRSQAERMRRVYHLNPLANYMDGLAKRLEETCDRENSQYMKDCLTIIADPYIDQTEFD